MTDDVITQLAAARTNPSIIMVVGVGGAGGNAVNHMWNLGIKGVDFMVCNTDQQALDKSPVELKVRLGSEGLGAGNDPENGRKAAIESLDVVRQRFEASGTKMVFITAGMGGGTGTGASPVIAKLAKEMGNADRRHRHFAAGRRRQDPLRTGVPGHRGAASERRFAADYQQREYS